MDMSENIYGYENMKIYMDMMYINSYLMSIYTHTICI